jgi:hypothetical protein
MPDAVGSQSVTEGAAHSPMNAGRYLAVLAFTIAAATVVFVAGLHLMDLGNRKPPPAFANSLCTDAKLEFLRESPPVKPTHLIVGSSISWRNIAAETIAERFPQARPLNGGFCGLQFNQTAFVTRFALERYPSVTDLLLVLDPKDMSACSTTRSAVFDTADVSAYLSGAHDLIYYFRYFDLPALLSNAAVLKERKANMDEFNPLVFTPYGDGPLKTAVSRGLFYGAAPRIDPACRDALAAFARDIARSGRHLLVVTMPLHSNWSNQYDGEARVKDQLAGSIREALAGTPATFWDAWTEAPLAEDSYIDAFHLRWSAARAFTHRLIEATGFGSGRI